MFCFDLIASSCDVATLYPFAGREIAIMSEAINDRLRRIRPWLDWNLRLDLGFRMVLRNHRCDVLADEGSLLTTDESSN